MKLIWWLFKLSTLLSLLLVFSSSYALWIDHFEVSLSPESAKIWEALDITIEAKDKNWATVDDYDWTILVFSESDIEADFPTVLKENSYTFTTTDAWKVKFENAVKFKNPWEQDIHVYDVNDESILWYAEVSISKDDIVVNEEINIVSPEDWITIWDNKVKVSWNTKKNHQVVVVLNSEIQIKTNSNSDWLFEVDVEWLENWENTLKAMILDADDNVIWNSQEVTIKIDSSKPVVKNVKVEPNTDVEPESTLNAEIISNKGLKTVWMIIDETLTELEEVWDGIYRWKIAAPKEEGTYKIDVILSDYLWHETKEIWAYSISVKEPETNSSTWEIDNTPIIDNNQDDNTDDIEVNTAIDRDPLKISWLKLTKLKTKSILTWDSIKDIKLYNVYIKNDNWEFELYDKTDVPRLEVEIIWKDLKYDDFAIRAEWYDNEWTKYEWDLSEATKIQTWPEVIILILWALLLWWLFFIFRRKKA